MLAALTLSLLTLPQSATTETSPSVVDDAAARRSAVEKLLTPEPWVKGHEFTLQDRMRSLNVPGASVAVIHEGRIDWAAGYGVRSVMGAEPVTPDTLFQAASISKPVSALATVLLAQADRLSLDAPINSLLTSWELPADGFDGEVTPRHILSHTGGLGVHGFPGYATYDPLPTAIEVLDGAGPANTNAVRRIEALGTRQRYSGGGSTIMQVALQDITGMDFASFMHSTVLEPLGMTHSTFEQPLPTKRWADHSQAHGWGGHRVPGDFHVYPEQFPAGLWTTPSDLARFAIAVQASLAGDEDQLLKPAWAERMVTPELENAALGFFIQKYGDELWFGHGGSNEGFKCLFRASQSGGRGVAVMTNGAQGSALAEEILRAVARVYEWPDVVEPPLEGPALEATELRTYAGRYCSDPDEVTFVRVEGERLVLFQPPERPYELAPIGSHEFLVLGTNAHVLFEDVTAEGAAAFRATGNPARAVRLGEFERWPIEDLFEGALEAGVALYREVRAGDPENPMVARDRLHNIAVSLWNYGHPEAGLSLAELVTELFPNDAEAWGTLGQLYAARDQTEAARAAYRTCLEGLADDPSLDARDRNWLRAKATSMLRGLER